MIHDQDQFSGLSWTSPINEFIREDFVLENEHATTHTTIEDALSHRSGLPRHDLIYGLTNDTPASIVKRIRYLPMTYEPRTMWQYCNLMYVVVTDLLQTITGLQLETILVNQFWKPLGMASTSFALPSSSSHSSLARGYYWAPSPNGTDSTLQKGRYVPEPYLDLLPISGAGATISTVNDYSLWVKAWLDAANASKPTNTSSPVTISIFHDLVTPRSIISESDSVVDFMFPPLYGLGWVNCQFLGETVIQHGGGLTGFGANVFLVPGKSFGVVTMGNTAGTSNIVGALIVYQLLSKKLGATNDSSVPFAMIQNCLLVGSNVAIPQAIWGLQNIQPELSRSEIPLGYKAGLPLPGALSDFAGTYSHSAYGSINFTLTMIYDESSEGRQVLQGFLFPRTWPRKLQLEHVTDTVFALRLFWPHGLGDVESDTTSSNDIVWEYEAHSPSLQAVFKFGLDGEIVETMGIELEPQMVRTARERGSKYWKEGMIWFEKV